MRTHLDLDDTLLDQVVQLGRSPTKKAAVNAALSEYVKLLKRRQLLDLRGKVAGECNLDQLRASRRGEAR
jgi:Arc/MetJ family transcription regulator